MKILITLSQLEVTGVEIYSISIANKLIELGHEVFIVSDTLFMAAKTSAKYISVPVSNRSIIYRVKNSIWLINFIRKNNIDIVNAHSRASAWVSNIACMIARIPLIVFVHGRQATFFSRKLFHAYGEYTIAICEKIEQQLLEVFNVSSDRIEVLRNGFDVHGLTQSPPPNEKIVSLIGRLSGPKGDLAFDLLEFLSGKIKSSGELKNVKFKVVGAQVIPARFEKFKDRVEFTGFVEGLNGIINNSSVIIGSGRIAIEALILNRPVIAIGEACTIGLVNQNNLRFALATNFGDMNVKEKEFDFESIYRDLLKALDGTYSTSGIDKNIVNEFDTNLIAKRLENIFQSVLVRYHRKEIPILCYHRVVAGPAEIGKHGIYVTSEQFDTHMALLAGNGFKTVSFEEALKYKKENARGKFVLITFDDGYSDNYFNAFPILKKYGFKALVFLVAGLESNVWDRGGGEHQFMMMNVEQLIEMNKYGIEFGSHTVNHKDLTKIPLTEAAYELFESKKMLEERLGCGVSAFAYPYGNCNEDVKKLARDAGYKYAFATDKAPLGLHEDFYQIRRIGVFPNTNSFGFSRKIKGNYPFNKEKENSPYFSVPH